MQGWRKSQEDSHIAELSLGGTKVALFGVFDGHGGKEVSIYVKENFVSLLLSRPSFEKKQYEQALRETFQQVDEVLLSPSGKTELKRISDSHGGNSGGGLFERDDKENLAKFTGCTATVVLVTPSQIFCANAGDSRSVLQRTNKTVPLSNDHKPDDPLEKARIESCGGFVDENRVNGSLNLSRSFGDFEYKSTSSKSFKEQMVICDPEITVTERTPEDDFIVLACDGIWDCLSNEACCEMLAKHRSDFKDEPLSKSIEEMFEKIIARDILQSNGVGTDNMTCVFVELKKVSEKEHKEEK